MLRLGSMRLGPLLATVALFGAGALLLAPQGGCSGTCNTAGQAAIDYTGGERVGAGWESTPIDGNWLDFPAGRRFRLMHHLGVRPEPRAFLAFYQHPLPAVDGGVGNFSEAAGNEVIYEDVNEEYVQVRNDTCAEFYLRVTLTPLDPSAARDAGRD